MADGVIEAEVVAAVFEKLCWAFGKLLGGEDTCEYERNWSEEARASLGV